MINFNRLKEWEDKKTMYVIESNDKYIIATLINSDLEDEMEIRITDHDNRFSIRGHKSIMKNLTINEFKNKVLMHIERNRISINIDRLKSRV